MDVYVEDLRIYHIEPLRGVVVRRVDPQNAPETVVPPLYQINLEFDLSYAMIHGTTLEQRSI